MKVDKQQHKFLNYIRNTRFREITQTEHYLIKRVIHEGRYTISDRESLNTMREMFKRDYINMENSNYKKP